MLLNNFSPMTGTASPNRFGGLYGGKDQHGRAARGRVGGDGALPVGQTGGEGADCGCRKLNPAILVMQSAQDWATKNVPGAIDGARDRRIFLQGYMRAGPIVIFHVRQQEVTEVALAEHHYVVKAFPADRTDQPFGISILPRGARRG